MPVSATTFRMRAWRLTCSALLLGALIALPAQAAGASPAAQVDPRPAPAAPPPYMAFTPDAYPRVNAPSQIVGGGVTPPLKTTFTKDGREVLAERLIVKFQPTAGDADRANVHAKAGGSVRMAARPVGQIGPSSYLVDVSGAATLEAAAKAYTADPRVQYVGPDTLMRADEVPNDPRFSEQWGMTKIQAPVAWNRTHGGAAAGMIAVLDTGIDEAHPDLAGRVSMRRDFTGSASGAADVEGHGTHVAGIVAAVANNGQGVAGVGYSVGLMNAKVLDDSGGGSLSQLINGINWASNNGAEVISMSLGATSQGTWDDCDPSWYEDLFDAGVNELKDAINGAWNRGIVLVASAGNNGNTFQQWPGSCTNVLSVANTQQDDTMSSTSTHGTWVDVAAPGTGILSTRVGGGFVGKSGTSMAAPHVAGLVALVRASCGFPTPQAVVNRITSTADPIGGTGSSWKHGRVNALAAACFPKPQGLRTGTIGAASIQILWNDVTPGESRFEVAYGPNGGPATALATLPPNSESFTHVGVPAGATFDYSVRACDAFGCSDWAGGITLQSNTKVLTVSRSGSGNVKGPGIDCGTGGMPSDCSQPYPAGTVVTLTAKGFVNSKLGIIWAFDRWENGCGTATTCTVTMNTSKTVRAVFVQVSDGTT